MYMYNIIYVILAIFDLASTNKYIRIYKMEVRILITIMFIF